VDLGNRPSIYGTGVGNGTDLDGGNSTFRADADETGRTLMGEWVSGRVRGDPETAERGTRRFEAQDDLSGTDRRRQWRRRGFTNPRGGVNARRVTASPRR
jgi:hypothetical protein